MTIKHKVLKDFQHLTSDKKIIVLKSGTIIEEYIYKSKTDSILIERDIIDNNPDFFEIIDWKAELISYMKSNKIPQPAQLSKKLIPFIEEMFILGNKEEDNSKELEKEYLFKLKELERREKELVDKIKELEDKKKVLADLELAFIKKESDLKNTFESKELQLEKEFQEKNNSLLREYEEKQKTLDGKENNLKGAVDEKERELLNRIKELETKEKEILEKNSDLLRKEEDLNKKISSIDDKEFEIQQRLRDLSENKVRLDESDLISVLTMVRDDYFRSGYTKNLELFQKYGYTYDARGIYRKES